MAANERAYDPVPAFRFKVQLDNLPEAGFSEVSGLQLEVEVEDYPEGGQNTYVHKRPGRVKQSNVTLKRGIVSRRVWDWFYEIAQGTITRKTATIVLQDPSGQAKMAWDLEEAFPIKWVGPDLNATQNNVAIESLELCYEGIKRTE